MTSAGGFLGGRPPKAAEPLLQVTDLHTEIRRAGRLVRAVDGVSLTVSQGESLGLVGESGCGKTMTALSVLGLLPPGGVITSGRIMLAGLDLTALAEQDLERVRGGEIGMVFQDPASSLNPTMTIGDQVAEAVLIHRSPDRRAAAQRALEVLRLVKMPDPERVARQFPHHLSGGMRQRAMIAIALACEPKLLIADEPTTALDVTVQREILELIDELRQRLGMAVILVTHDLGVIAGRTDRIAVMYGGRIVETAATAMVLAAPRHPYTEALLRALPELASPGTGRLASIPGLPPDLTEPAVGCRFAPRCDRAREWCISRVPELDGDHPGHAYACFFPVVPAVDGSVPWAGLVGGASDGQAQPAEPSVSGNGSAGPGQPPVLRVTGLTKRFAVTSGALLGRHAGSVSAVDDVSLEVGAGQTFGLVGESGCGKSTLARLIAGLGRPDAGSIMFGGVDLARLSGRELRSRRAGIQLMFQDAYGSLDPRMRAETIVREPLLIHNSGRKRSQRRTVARFLDEVGLPPDTADRYARQLSGGQRQRLALARALILQPQLIIADEPVSALDVSVQAQILNLMRKLQRQYGLSYLFISHDLSVVRYMAEVIGVMYLGKLVEVGPVHEVSGSPAHPYTRGLLDAIPGVLAVQEGARLAAPAISGELPSATNPPSGCRFRTRCPRAEQICAEQVPPLLPVGSSGRLAACHFPLTQPVAAPDRLIDTAGNAGGTPGWPAQPITPANSAEPVPTPVNNQ
jgi:peptide/nickel transport system ATP-binding protein